MRLTTVRPVSDVRRKPPEGCRLTAAPVRKNVRLVRQKGLFVRPEAHRGLRVPGGTRRRLKKIFVNASSKL